MAVEDLPPQTVRKIALTAAAGGFGGAVVGVLAAGMIGGSPDGGMSRAIDEAPAERRQQVSEVAKPAEAQEIALVTP